ncbi:pleckstrin homology domain-containing family N member 1 [Pseudonaja textilis]|uniref:pleckstrin homology domain-containing family N member 1 n=1 Tax=Pseudonaja textilis TaxID=8673 RepID=UPI000EAA58BC|nr:pleckstrin homology domain-containing family N member 1 [Pseudonaja textilis]
MGNMACVPQAPGRFRYSFSRKPSFKKEQESKKKLAGLFGFEAEQERDVTSDKILQYIPAKNFASQENEKENFDQRFSSLFKKGRRKTVVRNLGKIIHYSKLKFKFQHCQEANDCYLELFQEFLYFQALGPNGHKYQGLLPLTELQLTKLENENGIQEDLHAFQIAVQLEVETGTAGFSGSLYPPAGTLGVEALGELRATKISVFSLADECTGPSKVTRAWTQGLLGKEQLRWSMQNAHVQEWKGTQRKSLGDILCVSKVKLQHLPFQEQHHRLLVLYPSTLVIVSEERNGLYFKGELPLNAIQVQFEENQKTAFLIEGRLINSIRVICSSYEDYQEWLYCLKTAQFRHADSSLSGSESFSGLKPSHLTQFSGSGRGSLTSEGRTNSWASAGKGPTSTHHSQTSTASLSERPSVDALPQNWLAENPVPQPVCCSGKQGAGMPKAELKRKGSSRKSKGKGVPPSQPPQGHWEDSEKKSPFPLISKHPHGEGVSAVYNEPYSALAQQEHPAVRPLHLDLNHLKQWNVPRSQTCPAPQTLENISLSSSPMYADPYTPNSPSSHGAAGSYFLDELGRCHGPSTVEHQNGYPAMPVSVPICHHPLGWRSFQPSCGNPWREPSLAQRGNASVPAFHFATEPAPDVHYLTTSTSSGDGLRMRSLPTSDENLQAYNPPETGGESLDSTTYHDYAELQSFHEDYSYDNIWETEVRKPLPSDHEIYDC